MRLTTLSKAGLSTVAAVLVLTGCSGDESSGDAAASSSSTSSSSSSGSSSASSGASSSGAPESSSEAPSAEAQAFCDEAVSVGAELNDAFASAGSDPAQLATLLQTAADRFGGITAPEPVAADWEALRSGVSELATAAQGVDFTDPASATALQETLGRVQGPLTEAQGNVATYLQEECGITGGFGEAAPTS